MIEPAYISAVSALCGTFVGCITSIATSWVSTHSQTKSQRLEHKRNERKQLYDKFITEASSIYLHALQNSETEIASLVNVYATLNRMRLMASRKVTDEGEKALRVIIETYTQENKTFPELIKSVREGFSDRLVAFSEACHAELEDRKLFRG